MDTIKMYEQMTTTNLQTILTSLEYLYEQNENLIECNISQNEKYEHLKKENDDYDIDIHIIRMELNKRLWEDN
jgi:hypothetical protein